MSPLLCLRVIMCRVHREKLNNPCLVGRKTIDTLLNLQADPTSFAKHFVEVSDDRFFGLGREIALEQKV